MSDFRIEPINDQSRLSRLAEKLAVIPVIALDIETIDWWNRHQERIALIQIAYRTPQEIKVALIDTLAVPKIEPLRLLLERQTTLKVIHNAAFDASRLARHYKFQVAPIHDTMVAARFNREKKYSLQAQAADHLNLFLDKGAQRSDWSRRPLTAQQMHYAALDAATTLRLFEHQAERNLRGIYRLKPHSSDEQQAQLPLNLNSANKIATAKTPVLDSDRLGTKENDYLPATKVSVSSVSSELSLPTLALLGIITELPNRYGPEQLAVSVGLEQRVGLAGWIVDRTVGTDADFDEAAAKLSVIELYEQRLIKITPTGRLEATTHGSSQWQKVKTI